MLCLICLISEKKKGGNSTPNETIKFLPSLLNFWNKPRSNVRLH